MFCKVTSNSLLNNSVFSFSFRIIPETQSESTQSPVKGKMKNRKRILSDTDSSQDSQRNVLGQNGSEGVVKGVKLVFQAHIHIHHLDQKDYLITINRCHYMIAMI